MEIIFQGQTCFTIKTKTGTIVVDPQKGTKGLSGDIVTVSNDAQNFFDASAVGGKPFVIDWPGEYDKNEIVIEGAEIPQEEQGKVTAFSFTAEGITVTHLGSTKVAPSPDFLESIQDTDILLIPVGGTDCLDAKAARALAEKIEARITIPMMYDSPDEFMKEMGSTAEALPSLKIAKKDLPSEDSKTICLTKK